MRLLACLAASWLLASQAVAQEATLLLSPDESAALSPAAQLAAAKGPKAAPHDENASIVNAPAPEAPDAMLPLAMKEEPPLESAPVPEPGALLLVGTGLVGVALTVRRRRRPS